MGLFNVNNGTITDWLDFVVGTAKLSDDELRRIQEAAIKETAVRTAVGLIADLISGCEVKVIEDGAPVKNAIWYTFNVAANLNETGSQLIAKWIMKMYYDGESIIVPLKHKLFVADSYSVDRYPVKGDVYSGVAIGNFQSNQKFSSDRVYCLRQNDPRIRQLIDGIGLTYLELMEYSIRAYSQNSGEKYAFQTGTHPAGDAEQHKHWLETIKQNLEAFVSADSAAIPINRDQSIQRLSAAGTANNTAEYPALRKELYAVVAEILHIPGALLEGNITSVDQIVNEAFTFAIDPLVNMINQELTRKTYTRDQIVTRDCRIALDATSIKHVDVMDMAANIDKLISSGFMSIDEVRSLCAAPEIDEDWSREHYITKNYENVKGGEVDE